MMNAKAVGKRLQALRRSAGLTQENVAEALGISDNYVSNIETGRDICSMVVLLGMANLYHASMDYILGESLAYNLDKEADGERRAALLHEISRLDEVRFVFRGWKAVVLRHDVPSCRSLPVKCPAGMIC